MVQSVNIIVGREAEGCDRHRDEAIVGSREAVITLITIKGLGNLVCYLTFESERQRELGSIAVSESLMCCLSIAEGSSGDRLSIR